MGGLDPAKIIVILIIALIVLGPEKLPRVARQMGAAWRELTRMRDKFEEEVRSAIPDLDLPRIPTSPSRAVSGYINDLLSGSGSTSVNTPGIEGETGESADSGQSGGLVAVDDSVHGNWPDHASQAEAPSMWRPLLGDGGEYGARRPPSVPSMAVGGSLGSDDVFVLDEPSMN